MLYPGEDHLVPRESFDRLQTRCSPGPAGPASCTSTRVPSSGFSARSRPQQPVKRQAAALAWPQVLESIAVTTRADDAS